MSYWLGQETRVSGVTMSDEAAQQQTILETWARPGSALAKSSFIIISKNMVSWNHNTVTLIHRQELRT